MTRARLGLTATGVLVLSLAGLAFAIGGERGAEIRLTDFGISAPRLLPAGDTTLTIRNAGRLEHDLVVVRTDRRASDLPVGLSGVAPQLAGEVVFGKPHLAHTHDRLAVRRHHYPRGTTRTAALRLARGRYVLLCSLPGHYQAGQRAQLVVR